MADVYKKISEYNELSELDASGKLLVAQSDETYSVGADTMANYVKSAISVDSEPTEYSQNFVNSGRIYNALTRMGKYAHDARDSRATDKLLFARGIDTFQAPVTWPVDTYMDTYADAVPTQSSRRAVKSGGVYDAIEDAKSSLTNAIQAVQSEVDALEEATTPDETLTVAGAAADAKATGDEIGDVKSHLSAETAKSSISESISPTIFQGNIANNGNNVDSTTRIRTGYTNIHNGVHIGVPSNIKSRVFFYDENNNNIPSLSIPFATGDRFLYPVAPLFRIAFGYTDDSAITPSDASEISFTRYKNTDKTLTVEEIPADSATVGEAISKGLTITPVLLKWSQGGINNIGGLIGSTYRCRSKSIQGCDAATYIEMQAPDGYVLSVYEYNDQKAAVDNFNKILFPTTVEPIKFIPVTTHMYRVVIQRTDSADLAPADVPNVYANVYSAQTRDSETLQFAMDAISLLGANGDNEQIDWSQGSLSVVDGSPIDATNRIRSTYYLTYNSLRYLFIYCPADYRVGVRMYEQSNDATYIDGYEFKSGARFIKHDYGTMYKLILKRADEEDITPSEVPAELQIIPVYIPYWSKNAHGKSIAAITTKRSNPTYVSQIVSVAQSYYDHRNDRTNGQYDMVYGYDSAVRQDTYTRQIDCSTFVGLVLRGLPYEDTQYYTKVDTPASSVVANPDYVWTFNPQWYNYYSANLTEDPIDATFASQLGEWMIDMGWQVPKDKLLLNLEVGDVLFWSRLNGSGTAIAQPDRFMSINHTAICVAKEPTVPGDGYYEGGFHYKHTIMEVTSVTPCVQTKIVERGWDTPTAVNENNYNTLSLICRPDLGSI